MLLNACCVPSALTGLAIGAHRKRPEPPGDTATGQSISKTLADRPIAPTYQEWCRSAGVEARERTGRDKLKPSRACADQLHMMQSCPVGLRDPQPGEAPVYPGEKTERAVQPSLEIASASPSAV